MLLAPAFGSRLRRCPISEVRPQIHAAQEWRTMRQASGRTGATSPSLDGACWRSQSSRHGTPTPGGPDSGILGMTAENSTAQCALQTCPVDGLDDAGPPGRIKRPASRNPAAIVPGRETTGSRVHRPPYARSRPRQSSHHYPCRAQGPDTPRRIRRPVRPLPGPI